MLPKTTGSAQTHKPMRVIWIVWSTLYVCLWTKPKTFRYAWPCTCESSKLLTWHAGFRQSTQMVFTNFISDRDFFSCSYETLFMAWVNFHYYLKKKSCFNQFYCITIRRVKHSFVIFFTKKILDEKWVLVGWLAWWYTLIRIFFFALFWNIHDLLKTSIVIAMPIKNWVV